MAAAGRADHNPARHHTALPPLTHDELEALPHLAPPAHETHSAHHTALPRFDSALPHIPHGQPQETHTSEAAHLADRDFGSLFGGDRGRLTHPVKQRYARPDMPRVEPLDGSQRLSALLHAHPVGSASLREKVIGHCHGLDFADDESVHTSLSPRLAYMRKRASSCAPETKLPQELEELADYMEAVGTQLDEARAEYAQLRVTLDQLAADSGLSPQEMLHSARAAFDACSQCGETFLNGAAELTASSSRLKDLGSGELARLARDADALASKATTAAATVWELSDFLGWPVAMHGTQPQPAPHDLRAQLSGPNLAARVLADATYRLGQPADAPTSAREAWIPSYSQEFLDALGLDDEQRLKALAKQATGHEMPPTVQDRLTDMARTANGRSALLTGEPAKLVQTAEQQVSADADALRDRFQAALAGHLQAHIGTPEFDDIWTQALESAQRQTVIKIGDKRYREQDLGWHVAARHRLRQNRKHLAASPRSLSDSEAMRLARHLSTDELSVALRQRAL